MSDEHNRPGDEKSQSSDSVDQKLESLLPAPEQGTDSHQSAPKTVSGPMDDLLPAPGEPSDSADDASTREELEADTTNDGVDDIIPVGPHDDTDSKSDTYATHVDSAPTGDEESSSVVGNNDSDSEASRVSDSDTDIPTSHSHSTCFNCGATVGYSRFCPECGTEQAQISKLLSPLSPLFMWSRPLAIRVTMSIGAVLILLSLLLDSAAAALIISASIAPIVILFHFAERHAGIDRSRWVQTVMMLIIGMVVGIPISWIANRIVVRSWFDGGVVNFGATNFGGVVVETFGQAPFLVWLTAGLLMPVIMIIAIAGAPIVLRTALGMSPKESVGMFLSAGVAAGYAIGSAIVFFWPLFDEIAPVMSSSQWTLTILGIAIVRPLVWIYSGSVIGAVAWRYLRTASIPTITVPAVIAIGLPLAFSLVSLGTAPAGLWASIVVGIIFAGTAIILHARFLSTARDNDQTLAAE